LANLLESEFGGRRCEIINMPNRPDLLARHVDTLEGALRSLLDAAIPSSDALDISFFTEHAFRQREDDRGNCCDGDPLHYDEDYRTCRAVFFQRLLKILLEIRSDDCTDQISTFMQHAIPYYKAMAAKFKREAVERPSWWWREWNDEGVEMTTDQREWRDEHISELPNVLKSIAVEANDLLKRFLVGVAEGLNHCDYSDGRKPLLHVALEFASGDDGLALGVLRNPTTAMIGHQGKLPMHVAAENA
jgi:hypothetical protein